MIINNSNINMKSKTIDKSSLANIDLAFLDIEPFSKREALNWFANKASGTASDKNLSIRHIASIWKWHRSKVERFIKLLKEKGLIETALETGKASLTHCNSKLAKDDKRNIETAIEAKVDSNEPKTSERDRFRIVINPHQTQQAPCLQQDDKSSIEINSRQNRDDFESKQKKEDKNVSAETALKTITETISAHSIPCSSRLSENDQCNTKTTSETVSETKIDPNEHKALERDNFETVTDLLQTQQAPCLQEIGSINAETNSRQNPDSVEKKKKNEKKEKNQKKEKKEKEKSLKEKNIPLGDTKKEKVLWADVLLSSIDADEIYRFAKSLAMEPAEVEWEMAKFIDHLKSSHQKPPKNIPAAFRNWLRRSLEFNKLKTTNEQSTRQINQTKQASTAFERFLAGAARALAERQRHRLEGRHARKI
jgi:hypothetical protein